MRQRSRINSMNMVCFACLTLGILMSHAQPSAEILIDFEEFALGSQPDNFLEGFGIVDLITVGPGNCGPAILEVRNDPPFVFTGTSGTQFFGLNFCTPQPHSITLVFDPPLTNFRFSRLSTQGGGSSTPKWLAEALSGDGTVLDSVGEAIFQVSVPAAEFDLSAPSGEEITSICITSDNVFGSSPTGFATFNLSCHQANIATRQVAPARCKTTTESEVSRTRQPVPHASRTT